MHLFLMWADHKAEAAWSDATRVAAKFQGVFAPLLEVPLSQRIFVGPGTQTVTLELPARGWRPPFVHEGEEQRGAGWVLAADYPVNAASVLGAYGEHGAVLPALCRRLERAPVPLLKELAPPFCLLWSSPGTGETIVQHDGLGMSQLFVYDDGRRWAMSNKLMAFKALGLPIVPVAEEWAVRCTLGWFPRDTTGYRNIKFVGPGVQLRLSGVGVSEVRHDVLGDWCKPPRMSPEGAAELANYSVMEFVRGCLPLWDKPEAGLTGGWDSRAIVACLRACGAEFTAAVRGSPERHDVVIANDLARVAGIPLRVHGGGGLPPADAAECHRCITRALLWQAGHAAAHRHKTFLAGRRSLRVKHVNVTGQHGEIARRERALFSDDAARLLRAQTLTARQFEELTLSELLSDMPLFLRPSLRGDVRDAIVAAYHDADRYGLFGMPRVDFFSLTEFTRRKGAGVHAWQPRQVVAPFLNPGYIRAAFGRPGDVADSNALHRHIIHVNAPEWLEIPFTDDVHVPTRDAGFTDPLHADRGPHGWQSPLGRENYDGPLYWNSIGKPVVDEAMRGGGFWTKVFDPDLTAIQSMQTPELLMLVCLLPEVIDGLTNSTP